MNHDMEKKVLAKKWFYEFDLPSGAKTTSYLPEEAQLVHTTRKDMLYAALDPLFENKWSQSRAIDLACHEGYFASLLAQRGCQEVVGIDIRKEHVDDAELIMKTLQYTQFSAHLSDVHAIDKNQFGEFEIVLMFGLLYHLENPIGALRVARSLCKEVCLVETQVAPNLSGIIDWGNYRFNKMMQGSYAIIDETEETHGPEMSSTGICLCPSVEGLLWTMKKVGFKRVGLVKPPHDGYEQHVYGKRVMAIGYVE